MDVPIPKIGSKGVFTEELEEQLAMGVIDVAVHSAKDMPSELPVGFEIIAYSQREKSHDVLISDKQVMDLDQTITVGTSSTRRVALLKHHYPKAVAVPVRGNLQTRLEKLKSGKMDALVLAFAGVSRLELVDFIQYNFPLDTFVPAVGQGSLAMEVSSSIEPELRNKIRNAVNHPATELCLTTERSFLYTIQGGCSIPAFAHARLSGQKISMTAGIVSLDGRHLVQFEKQGTHDQAGALGATLAEQVLDAGGREILQDIKKQQDQNED